MNNGARRGRWKAGESGNPKGRKPGTGHIAQLRAAIYAHIPEIIDELVRKAKGGDLQAARLLFERVFPPMKAIEQSHEFERHEACTLTQQGRVIMDAVLAGELAPGEGAKLLSAVETLAKIREHDELAARVATLEERHETA